MIPRAGSGDAGTTGSRRAWDTHLHHDIALVLTDDIKHRPDVPQYNPEDVLKMLEGFAQTVDSHVRQVLSVDTRLVGVAQ